MKSCGRMRKVDNRSTRKRMKAIIMLSLLACLGPCVFADDQATPTPTPVYQRHFRHPDSRRRMERLERRRMLEADSESRATARTRARGHRRSNAAAQAQEKTAASAREQAQRQVEAEARQEAARETPHATSDLMKRMGGFSEQEIAAQKAREESAKSGVSENSSHAAAAEKKAADASPAPDPSPR
jgi:hypothetical protein